MKRAFRDDTFDDEEDTYGYDDDKEGNGIKPTFSGQRNHKVRRGQSLEEAYLENDDEEDENENEDEKTKTPQYIHGGRRPGSEGRPAQSCGRWSC